MKRGEAKRKRLSESDPSEMLRILSESTASFSGSDFFNSLAEKIIITLGIRYAIITECTNEEKIRVRTLVYIDKNKFLKNFEYDLDGTPCEIVMTGKSYYCTNDLDKLFPKEAGVKAYFAVPIFLSDGEVVGHIAVFDSRPVKINEEKLNILKIFASRAGTEIERKRKDEIIQTSISRYKNIFDFSPVGLCEEDFSEVKIYIDQIKKKYRLDLQSVFDQLPEEVFNCWRRIKRIRVNRAQLAVFDVKTEKEYSTYMQETYMPAPARSLLLTFESGVTRFERETEIVAKSGKKKNLKVNRVITPGSEKSWAKSLISCIDITELKKTQENLKTSLDELKILKEQLEAENIYLQQEIKFNHNFEEIVSNSKTFRKVLEKVEQVAQTDATVLILGESGTGKELISRAIHSISKRSHRPLVKVNCASLPANLIESELFGHEKGAFTGAVAQKIGRFELAHGGTLFLDEVGELPFELQSKPLRVLQEGEFERLGNSKTLKVNVRIIAATNRDLEESVNKREFRADLFYRLNVFPIYSPPLRERKDDIPYLVNHFCKKFGGRLNKKITAVSKSILEKLMKYDWPGNVRELENIIERGLIISKGNSLELGDWLPAGLPIESDPNGITYTVNKNSLQDVERSYIREVLLKTNWKIRGETGAAKILGLNPTTLEARMKKLGLVRPR